MKCATRLPLLLFFSALCLLACDFSYGFKMGPILTPQDEISRDTTPILTNSKVVGNDSSGNLTGCARYTTCSECTDPTDCVWCDSSDKCLDGNFWGPTDHIFSGCDDWRWKQCSANGRVIFWVSGAGACLLVLLFFMFCCICCVCRARRKKSSSWEPSEEEISIVNERKKYDRGSARAILAEKYGLRQNRTSGFQE